MKWKNVLKEAKVIKNPTHKIYLEFAWDRLNKDFIIAAAMPSSWDTENKKIFKNVKDFTLYLYHATSEMVSGTVENINIDTKKIKTELQHYMDKHPNKFRNLAAPGPGLVPGAPQSEGKWDAIMQIGDEFRSGGHSFGVINLVTGKKSDATRRESDKKVLPQETEETELLNPNLWKAIQDGTIKWSTQSPINRESLDLSKTDMTKIGATA